MSQSSEHSHDPGRGGKVFVTGGGGHLGANLVRALLDRGEELRCLVHPEHNNRGLEGLDVEIVEGDLRDAEAMKKLVKGCSRVYHTAAKVSTVGGPKEERLLFDINVVGTCNLLRAAMDAGVDKVVMSGSLSAVGFDPENSERSVDEETHPFYPFYSHMPYGFTKHLVEHYSYKAVTEGLPVVIATSCAIMGPNDFLPSRLGRTLKDFANGKLRAYIPGGFEFVAARDIVQGHLLSMDKGRPGQRYIFSTQYMTVNELMQIFEKVTGRPRPWLRLPPRIMKGLGYLQTYVKQTFFPEASHRLTPYAVQVLSSRRHADTSKAQRELGYQPHNMEDAIREQFEFFQSLGWIEEAGTRPTAALKEPL